MTDDNLERPEDEGGPEEDDVGYKKPPVRHRFPPGRSGNPRGRPKGALGLKAELRRELNERVSITQDGKTRRMPKRRIILKALTAKAAKGDLRAADKVLALIIQMEGFEDERPTTSRLSESDQQILDMMLGTEPGSGERTGFQPSDQQPDNLPASGSEKRGESQ